MLSLLGLISIAMRHLALLLLALAGFALPLSAQKERKQKDAAEQEKAMQQAMAAMFGNQNCPIQDNYNFDHAFTSVMVSTDKSGKEETRIKARNLISGSEDVMGIEVLESNIKDMPSSTMVLDMGRRSMVTLMDQQGNKMAICMSMDNPMFGMQAEDDKADAADFRKTGKTKEILGFRCEEWASEDADMTYSFWVSDKTGMPVDRYYDVMNKQRLAPGGLATRMPKGGMVLRIDGVSKKDDSRMEMEVVELKPKLKSAISTKGYQRF